MLLKTKLTISILTASLITAASTQATAAIPHLSHQNEKVLFVLSAKQGTVTPVGHNYVLTLNQVEPDVLWFSNHPNRKAGFVPTTQLINHWHNYFAESSPNGAFVHVGMRTQVNGKSLPMAMELSSPKDITPTSLQFKVTSLAGDHIKTGNYQNVSLFIDSGICYSPVECPRY